MRKRLYKIHKSGLGGSKQTILNLDDLSPFILRMFSLMIRYKVINSMAN